jgi:hypothetical protein
VSRTIGRAPLRAVLSLAAVGAALLVAPPAASAEPAAPPVSASGAPSELHAGDQLVRGEELVSPNGLYHLLVEDNSAGRGGALTLSGPPGPIWGEFGSWASTTLVMQGDGNFVGYDIDGRPRWATGTSVAGSTLVMQDDGNLVIYRPDGTPVWASQSTVALARYRDRVLSGQQFDVMNGIWSPNGTYFVKPQDDGKVVVYGANGAIWQARLGDIAALHQLTMQTNGDVVAVDPTGRASWHTATASPGALLKIQDDGNLVVYRGDGTPVWASYSSPGTRIHRSELRSTEVLYVSLALTSPHGAYTLVTQEDGNLVEYGPAERSGAPTPASGTRLSS